MGLVSTFGCSSLDVSVWSPII